MEELVEETRQLHDLSVRRLAGVLAGKVRLAEGVTKDQAVQVLREDVVNMRKLLDHYGRTEDANRN